MWFPAGSLIACVAFLVVGSKLGFSQTAGPSSAGVNSRSRNDVAPSAAPQFTADTTLALIPATVTDPLNRFVLGLRKEDFHLFDDGAEQTIAHLSGEDTPLSVGLVFDISGSMGDKLTTSREAALQFLKTMNSQDEVFLIEFSDRADLALGFTSEVEEIQNTLRSVQPHGLTAMLDAAEMAMHEMKKAKNARKAILIVSDGGDNHSRYSAREIQRGNGGTATVLAVRESTASAWHVRSRFA